MTLRLLGEWPGLVAIDKPPGLLVIPGRDASEPCAKVMLAEQLGRQIWVCHRIDPQHARIRALDIGYRGAR